MAEPDVEMVEDPGVATDCIDRVLVSRPDVVIMDIESMDNRGIETLRMLTETFPDKPILIQTATNDEGLISESIKAGASGYILKTRMDRSLLKAINELRQGGSPMSPFIARQVLNILQQDLRIPDVAEYKLTSREREVLKEIVKGQSHKMIGAELNISYETVRSHVKNLYEKLQVVSLTQMVAKAIRKNLV